MYDYTHHVNKLLLFIIDNRCVRENRLQNSYTVVIKGNSSSSRVYIKKKIGVQPVGIDGWPFVCTNITIENSTLIYNNPKSTYLIPLT